MVGSLSARHLVNSLAAIVFVPFVYVFWNTDVYLEWLEIFETNFQIFLESLNHPFPIFWEAISLGLDCFGAEVLALPFRCCRFGAEMFRRREILTLDASTSIRYGAGCFGAGRYSAVFFSHN